jgi:hypothetical protein
MQSELGRNKLDFSFTELIFDGKKTKKAFSVPLPSPLFLSPFSHELKAELQQKTDRVDVDSG